MPDNLKIQRSDYEFRALRLKLLLGTLRLITARVWVEVFLANLWCLSHHRGSINSARHSHLNPKP